MRENASKESQLLQVEEKGKELEGRRARILKVQKGKESLNTKVHPVCNPVISINNWCNRSLFELF
jgi:hypothetical protein